jgi:acetyl-CoA C-acetyltransferase
MRKVAIAGSGQTKHGKRDDVEMWDLIYEAVNKALEDAQLGIEDVQAVVSGSMPAPMIGINAPHLLWADALGASSKPLMRIATCGTTGMSIAHSAYYHIASGLFDVVLAVGAEKMYENDPQGTMATIPEPAFQRKFITGAPVIFAFQCNEYIHRYKLSEERVREAAATLSVRNHTAALDNPYAHIKIKITEEDVLKSRIIAYPIRFLDVCPASDGACAAIFVSEDVAKKMENPAWIKGVGYCGDEYWMGDSDKVEWASAILSAKKAYKMAGIENPLKDFDVAEVYNPFTYQEMMYYECFGFCKKGEALKLVEDEVVMKHGELPCDPSGGVLCTNPIGATALIRVVEAAMQVTGKAGKHQIDGAETAFASGMGGLDQLNGVMIVGV